MLHARLLLLVFCILWTRVRGESSVDDDLEAHDRIIIIQSPSRSRSFESPKASSPTSQPQDRRDDPFPVSSSPTIIPIEKKSRSPEKKKVAFEQCWKAPSRPQDRRVDKSKLRIGTLNVNFLMLEGFSALKCPGRDCDWTTKHEAMIHLESIADLVINMNADILQLSEVEDCRVLKTLEAAIQKRGGDASYEPYLIRGTDSYTGQNVAILTRVDILEDMRRSTRAAPYPIHNTRCGHYAGHVGRSKSVSKHFWTRFHIKGLDRNLTMIGAHFLAQPSNRKRCFQREAQAQVITHLIQDASSRGDEVVVLGDLNDFDPHVLDIDGHTPISRVVDLIRQAGLGLESVGTFVPQHERYTNWWNRANDCVFKVPDEVSGLDHIFLSKSIHSKLSHVHYGHDLFEQGCGTTFSDHFPLVATIQLDP